MEEGEILWNSHNAKHKEVKQTTVYILASLKFQANNMSTVTGEIVLCVLNENIVLSGVSLDVVRLLGLGIPDRK